MLNADRQIGLRSVWLDFSRKGRKSSRATKNVLQSEYKTNGSKNKNRNNEK